MIAGIIDKLELILKPTPLILKNLCRAAPDIELPLKFAFYLQLRIECIYWIYYVRPERKFPNRKAVILNIYSSRLRQLTADSATGSEDT